MCGHERQLDQKPYVILKTSSRCGVRSTCIIISVHSPGQADVRQLFFGFVWTVVPLKY